MSYNVKEIKDLLQTNPLSLLPILDRTIENISLELLPYSTGFEIECNKLDTWKSEIFKAIPKIMDVDCDSSEQRYRIPNGYNGLLCLYLITMQLHRHSELNYGSGIHYHVDLVECYDEVVEYLNEIDEGNNWILSELDSWKYKGTYNNRRVGWGWVRLQSGFRSIEIRIGEMTFDYELLLKRIIHCNKIVRQIKSNCTYSNVYDLNISLVNTQEVKDYLRQYITANLFLKNKQLENYQKELDKLNVQLTNFKPIDLSKAKEIIKTRIAKI